MKKIESDIWSNQTAFQGEKIRHDNVNMNHARDVGSYRELVRLIAELSFNNSEHVLLYRGQELNYVNTSGHSSFYPSIYRNGGKTLKNSELLSRYSILDSKSKSLIDIFHANKIAGWNKLKKHPELAWGILQHYAICDTPFLDLSHSLRVAASFSLLGTSEFGYLYVFGFPHPNGSISYSVDLDLINIRLLSICPPEAQRPYFQEGYLVGTFPVGRIQKHPSYDTYLSKTHESDYPVRQ